MGSFTDLTVKNRFYSLGDHFYCEFQPQGLTDPEFETVNSITATLLGLSADETESDLFLQVFSGNKIIPDSKPLAQDYAGHQLGNFNPMLGDGRAILLFDTENETGFWECHLKGAGQTPYSRDFDGRASLSGCLREFDLSQQLIKLGVPCTHSLCVISGKEQVYRGQFEPAAIITRVAPGFIRFGTFENYYFQRNTAALTQLTDYVIHYYYSDCIHDEKNKYADFFSEVVKRTARLIAHWQHVGFTHGMMNTDNQSILGITLDLGEASFTENHDTNFVSSSNDEKGRYAFGEQPVIGLWNCNVLARALSPIIADNDLRKALECYEKEFLGYADYLKTINANKNGIMDGLN